MAFDNMFRPGQILQAGAIDALQLKVWNGELLGTYMRGMSVASTIRTKQVDTGKEWQEPIAGFADDGKYHVTGESILTDPGYRQKVPFQERLIYLDLPFVINGFIPDIEEFQLHYSVRSTFLNAIAERHARNTDLKVLRSILKSARSVGNITGLGVQNTPTGSSGLASAGAPWNTHSAPIACTNANMLTSAVALIAGLQAAAQRLDENDAPKEGRKALLRPSQYWALIANGSELDRDVTSGNGDKATGTIYRVAGIEIVKSNAIADVATDYTTPVTGENTGNLYNQNFSENAGVVYCEDSAMRLVRKSMEMQMWYEKERFGHVITTRVWDGATRLRPECTVELRTASALGT